VSGHTNVVGLPSSTNYTCEQALQSAMQFDDLTKVMIIGVRSDGSLMIRSSKMACEDGNWLLDRAKLYTLKAAGMLP
jgi:hypothetical protein